jgi:hypothetical protein
MKEMRRQYIYLENMKGRDHMRHGKRSRDQLGRHKDGQNNNKMGFKETGCEGVGLTTLATDRAQWRAFPTILMNLRVP